MNKIFLVLLICIAISSFANSAITDYLVPSTVNLDRILTVDGKLSPVQENVQCSIRIYDDENNLAKRLTDEFTTSNGVFSSSYLKISEPTFFRTLDYNVVTDCAGSIASSVFTIGQRQSIEHTAQQEALFAVQKGNMDALMQIGIIILLVILFLIFLAFFVRMALRK